MSSRHPDYPVSETEESLMTSDDGAGNSQRMPGVIISTPGGGTARLPPLEGSSKPDHSSARKPLPAIHTMPMTPSQGGNPEFVSRDTIISVPEGDAGRSKHGYEGLMAAPGKAGMTRTSDSSHGRAIETIIYTMDKTGIHFTIEDGQMTEAGDMFEYVREELELPTESRQVFSLWLVSDLLELQLKPNHVPFKLACYWDELLEKYTNAPEEDIERDEPILMFQRNVFYARNEERKITHPEMLRLLYHEAKENVVDARYPLEEMDCDKMAGLQAHIDQRGFQSTTHTPQFYKDKLEQYYPAHIAKKKTSFFSSKEKTEDRIVGWHRAASQKLEGRPLEDAYTMYLQYCWKLPYYGAAFFRAQVEHPGQPLFKSVKDDPVYIAINLDGVFIIDMDDVLFLLGLLYEEMKWEYAEPCDTENRNCLPCLFLQFKDDDNRADQSKLLQVFSREAVLMDALIDSCIEFKHSKKQSGSEDQVDGPIDDDGDGILKGDAKTWRKFERLCLSTVQSGTVHSTVKKPSIKKKK